VRTHGKLAERKRHMVKIATDFDVNSTVLAKFAGDGSLEGMVFARLRKAGIVSPQTPNLRVTMRRVYRSRHELESVV
jgi:hypothetical protein